MSLVQVSESAVAGRDGVVTIRDYEPAGRTDDRAPFLWVHGGAFMSGGLDQRESDAVARAIATRGRRVRALNYRVVPRFPLTKRGSYRPTDNHFPAALDDISDVLADLERRCGRSVAIGGASAGACLVAGALLRLRDGGHKLPPTVVLAYGIFHSELPPLSESVRQRTTGPARSFQFSPGLVHRMNRNYAGSDEAMSNPYAFPGGADLTGLPPTLVIDGDRDTLRASGELFAKELASYAVDVDHVVVPGSRHGFFSMPKSASFATGIEATVAWLDSHA